MKIGSEWKGWTVTEYLGGGSFGKVYRIVREEFGYKYEAALKVIRIPSTEDEIDTVRLEGMTEDSIDSYFYSVVKDITSELAILSQLSGNSNIVSYEDHSVVQLKDEFGWEIYLRMELVTPLYEHLKGKELTKQEVLKIGIDICKALETCEKNNIIHRDIKPDNIFYSKQGTYKLGDFGIARKLDKSAAGMTKVGTFSYMAPEVYLGQPYDHTVDIYSLGIILYQFMNCNRRPFMPPYPDTISVDDNERANTSRLAGKEMSKPCNADDRFAGIILKACAFEHLDRYQDASELCRDLEALLDDKDADMPSYSSGGYTCNISGEVGAAGGGASCMVYYRNSPTAENIYQLDVWGSSAVVVEPASGSTTTVVVPDNGYDYYDPQTGIGYHAIDDNYGYVDYYTEDGVYVTVDSDGNETYFGDDGSWISLHPDGSWSAYDYATDSIDGGMIYG